ncbi:uncharacterized protein LOC133890270 [Phragmites australis]|uniref:uncharacterized protein LOC133890270 n=1 Tax=Phragmites australis TaxID=29695 RepID=UPI002D780040|nr:uncharacterized protein LOC133890270 [Phragmites australis]
MHCSKQYCSRSPYPMDRLIIKRTNERECNADEQLPQLLDSPLPTPRRSCASVDASRPRCRRDASPLRTHVPFSWESSPGVPKNSACRDMHKKPQEMPPPRPPPGRLPPCPARNWYYGNTSEASSDDDDDRSFSDALERISSPERTGSFDRVTSKRFEDIFVGRATSFAKDRHAAADAVTNSSSGRHPRQRQRPHAADAARRSHDEDRCTPRQRNNNVPMQLMQRIKMDSRAQQMSPRACGLMLFFPWSAKPAVCGFGSPTQHAMPRAGPDAPSPCSHSRRGTTLRDAIKEENEASGGGDLPQQRGEKRSRDCEEWQSRRWGVSSLLDTSKKYCTDARKALSKLSIGLGADGGSPRVSSERRRSKQVGISTMPATASKLTQLKANRN